MRHSTVVHFEHLGILLVSSLRFPVVLLAQQYSSSRGCVGYCTYCDRGDQFRLYTGCFVWSTPEDGCGCWCINTYFDILYILHTHSTYSILHVHTVHRVYTLIILGNDSGGAVNNMTMRSAAILFTKLHVLDNLPSCCLFLATVYPLFNVC